MTSDRIPDEDHVVRYCKPTQQTPDGQIQASAFMLRKDEEYLSVNWLESLNCSDRKDEIHEILDAFRKKGYQVSNNGKFAILNVGRTRETVLRESRDERNLDFFHVPSPKDSSHSGIYNMNPDNHLIAEIIFETVLDTCPAH